MLNPLIRFSLRHRPLIVAACLVALGYGGYLATTLPIDVFPDLDRPRVTVMTECPGLAAEEVETLVTFPLEAAVLGANGVQNVRTQSAPGVSIVIVEFGWGTDIKAARQTVQERLATAANDLPPEVRPQMTPVGSVLGQVVVAGLRRQAGPRGGELVPIPGTAVYAERVRAANGTLSLFAWTPTDRKNVADWKPVPVADVTWATPSPDGDQKVSATLGGRKEQLTFPSELKRRLALRTLADWVVRPRLLKVSGVANVVAIGGGRKQYHVLVNPAALHEYKVSLSRVEEALRANNVNFTGGFAELDGDEKPVRVIGRVGPRPEMVERDLLKLPLRATPDRTILLENVARVTEGHQIKRGDASVNGDPGVILTVTKQPHADTRAVSDAVVAALAEVEPALPADVVIDPGLYRLREFIDRGVHNVGEALVIGALLVLVVLFLFLLNVRTTFISLTAIPLSLAVTVLVFKLIGAITGVELSINVMTLGGIAVAMGELVDDAIVDVENIFRRLRENNLSPNPKPALRVVYEASVEVRSSIVFGTAVVVLVFLPLFALTGIEGRLFTPLGIAYVVSILASLVVSLTLTPVLASYFLANSRAVHREREGLLVRGLKWVAARLVKFSMKRAALLLLASWLLVAYCAWRLTHLGADFLPAFDEGTAQLTISLPAGASLDQSNRACALVDAKLRSLRKSADNPNGEVLGFFRRTGRGELDEHAEPPNVTDYIISVNPECGKPRAEVLKTLQDEIKEEVPGIDVEIEQPLAHLISHMISGSTAQIAVRVYGDDLDALEGLANQIKGAIGGVEGVSSLAVEPIRKVDEIHVKLRPDDLAFHGIDREYVGKFVQTALNGATVSQVIEGQRRFDLVVRFDEPFRADVANLGHLHLELPDKRHVHLDQLADITPRTGGDAGANQVKRDNARRRIVIKCNATGRDLQSVVTDIRATVEAKVKLPEGYFVEYGGQFEAQRKATRLILILSGVSVVGMFFVLTMLFPSARVVLQILNAIPTAFVGGVLALVLTNQTLTVASLVGFISLGGIAVRNGILLVTHYVHLMRHEGEQFTEGMILRGSLERLSPVLMTALTAGIGLLPLVLAGQQPGREILYPVATVILGGLITSTLCEFLIHPGLFWRFSGRDADRIAKTEAGADVLG
jgi:CzcA family heavy metal efflux pump